jgi:transcriptional regulator with XRE-family HTH domain
MAQQRPEIDPVQDGARRLGVDLRGRRRAAGLTQQALADRIGYDRSYLSQVEAGAQVPAEQFILQCERELAAGGDLLGMFRELLAEREVRRQQAHTKRWHSAVGESLRVERVPPQARELKTLQFVAWVAEHSRLGFQEVYDAVGAQAALIEGLAPSARHAQAHRRSRVAREQITQGLVAYYHSASMEDASATFYRARVGGVPLTLSVLVEQGWLGLAVRLGSDQERFRLVVSDLNSAAGSLEGAALEAALVRLASVEVAGTVLVNSPLYRLLDVDLGRHCLEAAVTVADFAGYALTMDLLETELVNALATAAPGRVGCVEPGIAGRLPLRDIYLPTVASALALDERLCVGGSGRPVGCCARRPFPRTTRARLRAAHPGTFRPSPQCHGETRSSAQGLPRTHRGAWPRGSPVGHPRTRTRRGTAGPSGPRRAGGGLPPAS